MTNLIYQGKITRQFWGKLIRQSTIERRYNYEFTNSYLGGGSLVVI